MSVKREVESGERITDELPTMKQKLCILHPASCLLLAFILLGVIYAVLDPVFEASDEPWHYPVVQHIASGRGLPVQNPHVETLWRQEGSQPPLYYALMAAATCWIDTSDMEAVLWRNPHAQIGDPLGGGNKNMIVHTPREDWPWTGTVLAVRLIRFLSVLLGAVTVLATYLLAREVFPGREALALGAAALTAFNPMFLFISASVNNDTLATALSAVGLLLIVQLVTRGATKRRLLLLGVVIGLASLAKISTLGLLPLAGLVTLILAWRRRSWQLLVSGALALSILPALIGGWWYARNWLLYGDPLGWEMFLRVTGARPQPATLLDLVGEFEGFRISYWGLFGGVNVLADSFVYPLLDLLAVVALLGLLGLGIWDLGFRIQQRNLLSRTVAAIPILWLIIVFVALIRWTSVTLASQGRLIFPAISAVSLLLFLGWSAWLPRRWTKFLAAGVTLAFGLWALVAPFRHIAPAYARPPLIAERDIPAAAARVHIRYGEGLELLACLPGRAEIHPGDTLPVTLYWRCIQPVATDYSLYIHLAGRGREPLGHLDAWPGNGSRPTSLWRAGDLFADTFRVPITVTAQTPTLCRVEVGFYNRATMESLPAFDPQGQPVGSPVAAQARLTPREPARYDVANPLSINLGNQAELLGYQLTQSPIPNPKSQILSPNPPIYQLTLYWRCTTIPATDYTVFVHVLGADGRPVAQADAPPLGGDYPTSAWRPGDTLADRHEWTLPASLPPGAYPIIVGLYDPVTWARLPVLNDAGQPSGDHVLLTTLEVTP